MHPTRHLLTRPLCAGIAAVAVALALSGSGALSPKAKLEDACRSTVADHVGAELADAQITERIETPGGSLDWRGNFPEGTFACGAGLHPDELYQVVVYAPDGVPTVIPL